MMGERFLGDILAGGSNRMTYVFCSFLGVSWVGEDGFADLCWGLAGWVHLFVEIVLVGGVSGEVFCVGFEWQLCYRRCDDISGVT